MADFAGSAVCWVELSAAIEGLGEFGFERGQLAAPFSDLSEFGFEDRVDMAAWSGAVVADVDDARGLCQRQSCGLCGAYESEPGKGGVVSKLRLLCVAGAFSGTSGDKFKLVFVCLCSSLRRFAVNM